MSLADYLRDTQKSMRLIADYIYLAVQTEFIYELEIPKSFLFSFTTPQSENKF